jgi:hypothetical protein
MWQRASREHTALQQAIFGLNALFAMVTLCLLALDMVEQRRR